jgi:uncharacterized protein
VHTSIHALRETTVDRLRGFALLGVVIVNAPFLLISSEGVTDRAMTSWADRISAGVIWVGFQGKAYLIFAFLFGYSFTIFLRSLKRRALPVRRVYVQRLTALLVIGVVHAVLLFPGDILVIYALLGGLCLLLHDRPNRTLWRWVVGAYAAQALFFAALILIPEGTGDPAFAPVEIDRMLREGGLIETTHAHVLMWPWALLFICWLQGPLVVGAFAMGLIAGRGNRLSAPEAHLVFWRRTRRYGLLLGGVCQGASALVALRPGATDASLYLGLVLQYLTAPLMSVGLVAAIVLLPRTGLAAYVEADGRMSLTVYLCESLVLTTLAVGWGFGLYGLTAAPALLAAVGTWAGLLIGVHLWQHYLGSGPAERLLRHLTFAGVRTANHSGPDTPERLDR